MVFFDVFCVDCLFGGVDFVLVRFVGLCVIYLMNDVWSDVLFVEGVVLIGDVVGCVVCFEMEKFLVWEEVVFK